MSVGHFVHRFLRAHVSVLGSILSVDTDLPDVILTYDDGPEPRGTDRVLEALARRGAHATFFMLSRRAQETPSLVADVVAEGHEIALHGPDHRSLRQFSPSQVTARTRSAAAVLEDVAGEEVRWMRPPYGRQGVSTYRAIRRAGLWPVMWTASTRDTVDGTLAERVKSATSDAARGTILLSHDGRAGPPDGVDDGQIVPFDRGVLATAVLEALSEQGLRGTSLGRALESGKPRLGAWFG